MRAPSSTAPSRLSEKQISAFLPPQMVDFAHQLRARKGMSIQEIVAMSINTAVAMYGRTPFLQVGRERLIFRKQPSAITKTTVPTRKGKRRMAAWFDIKDVERLLDFTAEVGTTVENLIEFGLGRVLMSEDFYWENDKKLGLEETAKSYRDMMDGQPVMTLAEHFAAAREKRQVA